MDHFVAEWREPSGESMTQTHWMACALPLQSVRPEPTNGRIDTAVTVQHRPQTDRQSLRFALNSNSSQSENISGVTQERIQDSSENKSAACAFKMISWFLSRTMCRRIEMKAIKLFAALVVCSMATSAQAGLFGCFKSNSGCGCSVEPTCCAPVEASCCAPAALAP